MPKSFEGQEPQPTIVDGYRKPQVDPVLEAKRAKRQAEKVTPGTAAAVEAAVNLMRSQELEEEWPPEAVTAILLMESVELHRVGTDGTSDKENS